MQDPLQFDLVTTSLRLQSTSFDDEASPAADWWPQRDLWRAWRCHYIKCASHPRTRATPTRARHLHHLPETASRVFGTPSPHSNRAWLARRTGTSRALLTRHCSPRPQRPPALYFTASGDQGMDPHLRLKLHNSCLWVACVGVAGTSACATRVHAACGAGWSWRRWAWQGRVLGVSSDRSDVQA